MSDFAFPTDLRPRTELGPWPQVEGAVVYVCVPPMLTDTGFAEFVIVATEHHGAVAVFPCDKSGFIQEWDPAAEFPAGVSHGQALRACGFEVVSINAA